jgi:membrane-associated protein
MDYQTVGYWLTFLLLAAEGTVVVGIFFPGVSVLIAAGFLAGVGDLNPYIVFALAVLGLMTGDTISYAVGRFGAARISRIRKFAGGHEERARAVLGRRRASLLLFQFPLPTRIAVPLVAGVTHFSFRAWVLIDLLASLVFVVVIGGIGYAIGRRSRDLDLALEYGKYVQLALFTLLVVYVAYQVIQWRRNPTE